MKKWSSDALTSNVNGTLFFLLPSIGDLALLPPADEAHEDDGGRHAQHGHDDSLLHRHAAFTHSHTHTLSREVYLPPLPAAVTRLSLSLSLTLAERRELKLQQG